MKNKIINDDFLNLKIKPQSVNLVIADPPYHKILDNAWDNQHKNLNQYLNWCDKWIAKCVTAMKPTASFYLFGFFEPLQEQRKIMQKHGLFFRKHITLYKNHGGRIGLVKKLWNNKVQTPRNYAPMSEYLHYYTKQDNSPPFETGFAQILKQKIEIENAVTKRQIARMFPTKNGDLTGCVSNWTLSKNLPTKEQWEKITKLLKIKNEYKKLRNEYSKTFAEKAYPFNAGDKVLTDVWHFENDKKQYDHPTQKPQKIVQRIIEVSSNEKDTVLVPFVGSGSECVAAIKLNRNFIGAEIDETYYAIATKRIEEERRQGKIV